MIRRSMRGVIRGVVRGAALLIALAPAALCAEEASREARSLRYCSVVANLAGYYDTESALACRREEYTAAARVRSIAVPADVDEYCESLAGEGDRIGPFSWRAYVDCVDGLLP